MVYQDLLKDTSAVAPDDNNKFIVTVLDLDLSTIYPIQFRWKYKDGTFGKWSTSKNLATPAESFLSTPSQLTATGGPGFITVTWDGKDNNGNTLTNFKQLDIYIAGSPFDGTKPADTFFSAGTKTISAPAGDYFLTSYAVSQFGTKSFLSLSTPLVTVTSSIIQVDPSELPSTPTVSSVLGAIQLSWNGKTATNTDQPSGFKAAKVYVGTTAGFTPIDTGATGANQVDVLNFGNGQNTLNIGLGTIVNGVALDHGVDYYVKIKTTNGNVAQDSTAVAATGNPVRVGQVQNGSLVTITADKIATGTISSQTITVGSPGGKRVELRGSGNPLEIFGTGGTSLLSYDAGATKLTITGDGTFTGNISGATGTLSNALNVGTAVSGLYPFSVSSSGVIRAISGKIGGWTLGPTYLQNTAGTFQLDSDNSRLSIGPLNGANIKITTSGIGTYSSETSVPGFNLATTGVLTLSGGIVSGGSISGTDISGSSITGGTIQTTSSSTSRRIVIDSSSPNRISFYPKTGDESNISGYIEIGDDTGSATLPGFKIVTPSASGWAETSISATATQSGGIMKLKSLTLNVSGITTFSSWAFMDGNFSASTPIFRNIGFDTAAPVSSDGRTGEIWIQY